MHHFDLKSILTPEFDYIYLMGKLAPYHQPWAKIRQLLRQGQIIRVKKGIYVKGAPESAPYSKGVLANMIFGPSYLSYEYALAWHGLIPEGVEIVTSATLKPNKTFETPVGSFVYRRQPRVRFATGFQRAELDEKRGFLIATREKALVDTIFARKFTSTTDLHQYLTEDLRIEELELRGLKLPRLAELKSRFRDSTVDTLFSLVEGLKK